MNGNFSFEYGAPDSLQFVEGDPEPYRITRIIVDRVDGGQVTITSRGMLAGANLVEYFEASPDETVVAIEESSRLIAEYPLQQ